jgi:two-component system, OmpR family, response regulator ChvI
MHTSKSFNNSTTTSSYYNTTSKSENGTKITEEGEAENEITFSDKSQNCCVCFVIMTDPLSAITELKDPDKIRRYYSVFINTTAAIARNFNAKIIKNTASSLIFYFPKTSTIPLASSSLANDNGTNTYEPAFRDVMECGITMIMASDIINAKLKEEGGLPSMHYKISADYGRVEVARSLSSPDTDDLFGSTMNICAKINSMASANGMVIGGKLYYIVRKISTTTSIKGSDHYYKFKGIGQYSIDTSFKHQYAVYSLVSTRNNNNTLKLHEHIPKLKALVQIQHECAIISTLQQLKKSFNVSAINFDHYQQEQEQSQKHNHDNILLIDDEPDILLTYKAFLLSAAEGYNVVDAFTDSQKALQQFVQVNPSYYDLVIMDIRMPSLNGLQLCYILKALSPNVKVLFVSALDAAQEMVEMLPGVKLDDIIKKPVGKEQFLYKVKMTLISL